MSYIIDIESRASINLRPGEKILFFTKPNKWSAGVLLTMLVITILLFFSSLELGMLVGLIFLIMAIINASRANSKEFIVTNKRVVIKGNNLRNSSEFLLEKIEGCDVYDGAIMIKGTGGTKHETKDIPNPFEFRDAVYDAIEALKHNNK